MSQALTKTDFIRIGHCSPNLYGEKTAMLLELYNALQNFDNYCPISIPDYFGLSVGWQHEDVRNVYDLITNKLNKKTVIAARSSDPDEKPDEFESYPSIFDPDKPEESLEGFIKAAEKVRNSGARAVLGQIMDLDYGIINFGNSENDLLTPCFGYKCSGFVTNSDSLFFGDNPIIIASWGLSTKFLDGERKDRDISMLMGSNGGLRRVVNLEHDYRRDSEGFFKQQSIDVIVEDPVRIINMPYNLLGGSKRIWDIWSSGTIPFNEGHNVIASRNSFNVDEIFRLLDAVKSYVGCEVELEGNVNYEKGVSLFQLRRYEMPNRNLKELTENPGKVIFRTDYGVGFNRFKGDLYISDKLIEVPENAIFFYNGDPYKHNPDDFNGYKQLMIPKFCDDEDYTGMHSFGQTVRFMYELEQLGIRSIAIGRHKQLLPDTIELPEDEIITEANYVCYKDVTVECVGLKCQIFLS